MENVRLLLGAELKKKFKRKCLELDVDMSSVLRDFIKDFVARPKKEKENADN